MKMVLDVGTCGNLPTAKIHFGIQAYNKKPVPPTTMLINIIPLPARLCPIHGELYKNEFRLITILLLQMRETAQHRRRILYLFINLNVKYWNVTLEFHIKQPPEHYKSWSFVLASASKLTVIHSPLFGKSDCVQQQYTPFCFSTSWLFYFGK